MISNLAISTDLFLRKVITVPSTNCGAWGIVIILLGGQPRNRGSDPKSLALSW